MPKSECQSWPIALSSDVSGFGIRPAPRTPRSCESSRFCPPARFQTAPRPRAGSGYPRSLVHTIRSGHLMHVVKHATWDADDQHLEIAPGPVLHDPRHVHGHVLVQLDLRVVELHPAGAVEDVVNLVRAFVVV